MERLFGNQAQVDGGLRHTAKRGALHSGVQDRQGSEGGDRRHECRNGACAVRLHLHARNGCERTETVCGYPSLDTPWRPSDLQQRDGRGVRAGNEIAKHFAGNNVDVIIYAVEKSLDSYKFNLLHCKQTFISQLKSGAMGARTIDEGGYGRKIGHELLGVHGVAIRQHRPAGQGETGKTYRPRSKGNASLSTRAGVIGVQAESKTAELRNNTAVIDAMRRTGTASCRWCRPTRRATALI